MGAPDHNQDHNQAEQHANEREEHGTSPGTVHGTARFRIGVFAIIEQAGRYLLAHRADIPWWNLPGGGLEYGETLEEGLVREVREEIGVAIAVARLVGVYPKPQKREVVFAFLCHLAPGSPAPGTSDEVRDVAWFLPQDFPTNLLPKHRERLEDALRDGVAAVVRAQTSASARDQGLDEGVDEGVDDQGSRGG